MLLFHVRFKAQGLGEHLLAAGARVEHLAIAGNMALEVLHECLLIRTCELAKRAAHGLVPLSYTGLDDAVATAQVCL